MMSKEKRRVPKLRFPGFTEDWEQRKLDDIAKIKTGGGTPKTANPEYWSGNIPWIQSSDLVEGDIAHVNINKFINNNALKNSAAKLISRDSIALVTRVGVGKVAVINHDFTTSQDFLSLSDFDGNDIKFLAYQLYRLMQENAKVLQGTSIKGITKTELIEQSISIPSSGQEQNLISNVLSKIDSIITLHQRKLDNLKLKKKALLQKLFPKNGERYPELRFPGFTDTWEQRKLGECMNSFAYGLNAAAKEYDGMHKYIRITDIDDETHNFIQSNLTSPDIDFNMDVSDYKLNVGDIVFARTGASVGKTYLYNPNDGDLYYAGFLIRGKVKEDCDAGFIYQNTLTKDYDSFIKITSQRSGQPGVNSKEYATFRLNIPCKDEQEQISKVLNSLDELFTLHQRKLDHLQLQKKALLQQIFV